MNPAGRSLHAVRWLTLGAVIAAASITAMELMLALAVLTWLARLFLGRRRDALPDAELTIFLGLFMAWNIVSALVAADREQALAGLPSALLLLVAVLLAYGFHLERAAFRKMERENYYSTIALIGQTIENSDFARARELLLNCPKQHRNWEWGWMLARCNRDMMTLKGHAGVVCSVAYSPDGKLLASAAYRRAVDELNPSGRVWDTETGRLLFELKGHDGGLIYIAFSPDGKYLATASDDHTAKLWNAQTGREIRTFTGDTDHDVIAVDFSPNSSFILTGSENETARIWNVDTRETVHILICHNSTS